MKFKLHVADGEARRRLRGLLRRGENLAPLMLAVSEHLKASIERSFDRQGSPEGAWAPLKPATVRERRRKGYGPTRPILIRQGGREGLLGSITSASGRDWAAAGTNLRYAATHQFGRDAIPARPFLALWPEEREELEADVRNWLLAGARKRLTRAIEGLHGSH